MFLRDAKSTFQGDAGRAKQTFAEKRADEGDAMRNATRRVEGGQGMQWIRRPIAARLRDLNKSSAECKRGMSGEVGDRQHFVA